jgi:tetratricopeptide (TPR) repeat protein
MSGKKTSKETKRPPENPEDVDEILSRAYESEDEDEIGELTDRVLALDPDNPEALLLKADLLQEDEEERLRLLERARKELERYFQAEGISGEDILDDEADLVYLAILQRIAYTLFSLEEDDRALEVVEELLRCDPEGQTLAKTLYYRIYLEREEWARVLEETMKETKRELGWAYARLTATFMLSLGGRGKGAGKTGGKDESLEKVNKMLWDAVRMAPSAPFYMLGYLPEPVDDSEEEEDAFYFGVLYEGILEISRDLLNWFSKAAILFGLPTGRFGGESDDMREILDALGGTADYEELTRRLAGADDDDAVLRALSDGNYPSTR